MTYKPTLEVAILVQRVGNGDFSAVPELWPLLFEEPLDQTRPVEDIANDLAKRITELTADDEAEKSEEPKTPAEIQALIIETTDFIIETIRSFNKRK